MKTNSPQTCPYCNLTIEKHGEAWCMNHWIATDFMEWTCGDIFDEVAQWEGTDNVGQYYIYVGQWRPSTGGKGSFSKVLWKLLRDGWQIEFKRWGGLDSVVTLKATKGEITIYESGSNMGLTLCKLALKTVEDK